VSAATTDFLATLGASYWSVPSERLLATLRSSPNGLSREQAKRRRTRYGLNTLPDQARVTWLRLWLGQFRSPLMLILLFAAAVALLVQDVVNAATVLAIVIGSALLGFIQEYRANAAIALTQAHRNAIQARLRDYAAQGHRVLGVAYRALAAQPAYTRADEHDLVFAGFLLFFDPPDPDARQTLADLARLGVKVNIITGDNRLVALHVANEVGPKVTRTLTGSELRGLRDEALWHLAEHTQLFAEVDPNQKEQIILALKRTGHYLGASEAVKRRFYRPPAGARKHKT